MGHSLVIGNVNYDKNVYPLHAAIQSQDFGLVQKMLLDKDEKVSTEKLNELSPVKVVDAAQWVYTFTPLGLAIAIGDESIFFLFLQRKDVNLNIGTYGIKNDYRSCLDVAWRFDRFFIFKTLLTFPSLDLKLSTWSIHYEKEYLKAFQERLKNESLKDDKDQNVKYENSECSNDEKKTKDDDSTNEQEKTKE